MHPWAGCLKAVVQGSVMCKYEQILPTYTKFWKILKVMRYNNDNAIDNADASDTKLTTTTRVFL